MACVSQRVSQLVAGLKGLQTASETFCHDSSRILKDLRRTNSTLQNHAQVGEVEGVGERTEGNVRYRMRDGARDGVAKVGTCLTRLPWGGGGGGRRSCWSCWNFRS